MYIWTIYPELYVKIYNILFDNNMIEISDIYVSTNWYLLQQISMNRNMKNSQHSMLAHPDFNNILIDN